MWRIVHETVAGRIRHRALLEVLQSNEAFDFETYKQVYLKLLERDAAALVSKLILKDDNFTKLFGGWQAADKERYGTEAWPPPKRATPAKTSRVVTRRK